MSIHQLKEAKKMCRKNYAYFKDHLDDLCTQYDGKFVVIADEHVWGIFETFDDAYQAAADSLVLGTFIIQQCTDQSMLVNQFYSNNVVFS